MDLGEEVLLLPKIDKKIQSATYFKDGSKLKFKQTDFGLMLEIPYEKREEIDTVIVLQL